MSHNLINLRSKMFNTPLCIWPTKFMDLARVVGNRMDLEVPAGEMFTGPSRPCHSMIVGRDNIAVIQVIGTLVNRGAFIGASSGLVSYEGLRAQIRSIAKDSSVETVFLDIDSCGGEAAGLADTVAALADLPQRKIAMVDSHCLSAAYWLATACDEIWMTNDSLVGSVGAIAVHFEQTTRDEQEGDTFTIFASGNRKSDFSPHLKLATEAAEWLQAMITESANQFIESVAQNRGLDAADVRGFQAALFKGRTALASGLADRIISADEAIVEIMEGTMATVNQAPPTASSSAKTRTQKLTQRLTDDSDTTAGSSAAAAGADDAPEISAETQALIDQALEQAAEQQLMDAQAAADAVVAQRVSEIANACKLVGRPEMAADLIASGCSVDQAREQLFANLSSSQAQIDGSHDNATGQPDEASAAANFVLNAGKTGGQS